LPLKTHVFADSSCSESRASLYYFPAGFCIGPLFHPANSIRILEQVPTGCNLTAYADGSCKGSEVDLSEAFSSSTGVSHGGSSSSGIRTRRGRKRKVLAGPTELTSQCYGMGDDFGWHEEGGKMDGANSFFLRCEGT
jgi:hypothetical protein